MKRGAKYQGQAIAVLRLARLFRTHRAKAVRLRFWLMHPTMRRELGSRYSSSSLSCFSAN